jgi:hypothetical protein
MIERRYQIFLSSTFLDLQEERSEAIQALLELDCMPAGMELFPAADEQQWNWIKRIIDQSDYYVVVVGGRYGSIHTGMGLSYTEMEYRYAIDAGKPVLAFLHEEPGKIPVEKSDIDAEKLQKLLAFRSLCEQRLCKYWNSPADLAGKIARSVNQLMKREPRPGWVRGDAVSEGQQIELLTLRQEVSNLREQLTASHAARPTDDIASGTDEFDLRYYWLTKKKIEDAEGKQTLVAGDAIWRGLALTWNQILAILAPVLTTDDVEKNCVKALTEVVEANAAKDQLQLAPDVQLASDLVIGRDSIGQIRIQLVALGLITIEHDSQKTSLTLAGYRDTAALRKWQLTEVGRIEVARAAALRKGERRARDPKKLVKGPPAKGA